MKKFGWIVSLFTFAYCSALVMPTSAEAAGGAPIPVRTFYESSKSGKIIDFAGDSTTEAAQAMFDRISRKYAVPGGPLEGAEIHNSGTSGNTLHNFVNNIAENGNTLNKAIQTNADLYILSYGINDIRGSEIAAGSSPEQIKHDLKLAVDRLLKETNGAVLLRTPNPFLSKNTSSSIYLTPIENAQLYSDQLREVYDSFNNYDERVDVLDIPGLVFGRKAMPEHPLMQDTLHPNDAGYLAIADAIVDRIKGKSGANEVQAESYTQTRQVNKTIVILQEEKLYDDVPDRSGIKDGVSEAAIMPQTVQVVAQKGEFYKIKTWAGDKWINPVGGALEITPVSGEDILQLKTATYVFNNPYTANSGPDDGFMLAPQKVKVLARWHGYPYWKNEWYYQIETDAGPRWINVSYALPAGVQPVKDLVAVKEVTYLKKYPWDEAYKLGSITPQTVQAFEKGNGWYHIRSWAGDAWIKA